MGPITSPPVGSPTPCRPTMWRTEFPWPASCFSPRCTCRFPNPPTAPAGSPTPFGVAAQLFETSNLRVFPSEIDEEAAHHDVVVAQLPRLSRREIPEDY